MIRKCDRCSLASWLLVCLFCQAATLRASPRQGTRVFLQNQLPLSLVVTTPAGLAGTGAATIVSGRDPLTAVFSRPVIALGSDFAQPSSQRKLPFTLTCPVPGKLRWVTTTIARFDPDVDWPSDLDCELRWETSLTAYDGAPLVLGNTAPRRRLATAPLSMWLADVTSQLALNITDGLWTANVDGQYEVPPDGKILLNFGHAVNLRLLKSVLKVVEASRAGGAGLAFDVAPCVSYAPWMYYGMAGLTSSSSSSSSSSFDTNTTCAEITPTSQLKPGVAYSLLLPRGSRYHALAGPLQRDLNVTVFGLRPFQLPFLSSFSRSADYGTRYRRLDLWLPHGLSPDTPPEALAARISLCQLSAWGVSCTATPFTLSLVSRGRARLSVPSLKPRTQYRIAVAADATVRDGFGQGLIASDLTFWTAGVNYDFASPGLDSGVAMLEPSADALQSWPFITRGVGPSPFYGEIPNMIRAWELDLAEDRVKALVAKALPQSWYLNGDLASWFGAPTSVMAVPSELLSTGLDAPDWTQLLLPLRDGVAPSRARLVAYSGTRVRQGAMSAKLLLNSSLSLNVMQAGQRLTAWVLDAAPSGGPVEGAVVTVFHEPSGVWLQDDPLLLGKCTTDASGLCTITHSANNGWLMTVFAVAGGQFAMLESAGFARAPTPPPNFVGSLVADRLAVVPGDSVKITGFLQRITLGGLQLPGATYAALQVSPRWEASTAAAAAAASTGGETSRGLLSAAGARAATTGAGASAATATAAVSTGFSVGSAGASAMAADVGSVAAVVGDFIGQVGIGREVAASSSAPSAYLVKVNGTTGTFHTELVVPKDARLQSYTLQLSVPAPVTSNTDPSGPVPSTADSYTWPSVSGAQLVITVADPRPPTADLKVSLPAWAPPNSSVALTATAVSYIGASVAGAVLTVTWRTAKASGLMQLLTDADGVAAGAIDLGALPAANLSEPYDSLDIDVQWTGPTRERITRAASVIMTDSPVRLDLQLSLTPCIPGTAFAVAASVTSNGDGTSLPDVPVTVTLRPATPADDPTVFPGADSETDACDSVATCAVTSGAPLSPDCQLALPCVGRFVLEACADVPSEAESEAEGAPATQRVCSRQALGLNSSEWAARPLKAHPEPKLLTDKTSYALGDVVRLQLQNPWPGARLLVQWGNQYASHNRVVNSLDSGLVELTIGPLAAESVGGGAIVAVLDVPRLTADQLPLPPASQLAVSSLFDPRGPHSHVLSAQLNVRPENALAVSVDVAAVDDNGSGVGVWSIRDADGSEVVAVEPGAQAQITVSVKSGLQADAPAPGAGSVEVTVYGVDKAFLDLLPYDLPRPEQEIVLRLAADINTYGVSAYRLAPGAVRAVYDKLMARLTGLDPWLPLDTSVRPADWSDSPADCNDTAYLARFSTALTSMPGWWHYAATKERPVVTADSVVAAASGGASKVVPEAALERPPTTGATGGTDSAGAAPAAVRYATDFVVTPLFTTTVTDASGVARVTFTAPQNLGTFVLRAFAAAGASAQYGSGEGKVAVRRRLSLTPSLPRFVRVGDSFQAGVLVTVGSAPATVRVSLQLAGRALSVVGNLQKTVSFEEGDGLQREVRFAFTAGAVGSANLTFTAQDSQPGGGADALQLDLRVAGQQGDVWVATSFALTALPPSADRSVVQWHEGMTLPAAVPGSGGLNLTAGVGYFPAVASVYDTLQQADADRSYAVALPAMLWATLPAVLSYYAQQPGSGRQSDAAVAALRDLVTLTDSEVGLQWSDPSRWWGWRPSRADLYLNTWAVFLASLHGPALRSAAAGWASLESSQVPAWRAAVAKQLVADAAESRRGRYPGPYSDWHTLAWARLVLGGEWVPRDATDQIRNDLSLAALIRAANQSASRQTRVVTCLVLQSLGSANPASALVAATVQEVTSALRVQGRTAHLGISPGSSSPSTLDDQALSLLLLLRSGANHQLLPKLAAYVANPPPSGGYGIMYYGHSWRDQALALAALTEYDRTRGSSQPDVELAADVNGLTVLRASFKTGGSTRPVSNTTAWEALPAPKSGGTASELNFEVVGTGEVTVAASLHFVPAALVPFPTYRGLYVEAALQLADPATGQPTGRRISSVPLGSLVALTLQLTSPDDLGPVTLSVMMPGGLEPLDPNLQTGAVGGLGLSCGANWVGDWGSFYRWWWWPMCPSQETRPSVVTFSFLALRAGTSSVTLRAVAATPGTFVLPPVRASADRQPELMGMTAAGSITVCADCDQPTFAGAPALPQSCPNDCSGNGLCNLKTGRCRCDPGFGRADCSRAVA